MGYMKKIILIVIAAMATMHLMAQEGQKKSKRELRKERINAIIKQEEEGVIKYKKHTAFGVKLTSDGYGGFFEIGRGQTVKKALLFQLDITERKHPKDEKQQFDFSSTVPIMYGKINFFYPVKLGVQKQFLLGNKSNKNGVSITTNVGGGFIAGLLRPYMIEVNINGERKYVQYNSADSSYFLNGPYIGGPSLGTGWNKMKVTPGIYVKPALRFDYGKFNELVSAIEVGLNGEFYTKKIEQTIKTKQKQFFFSAYVSIMFGRRK